MAKKQKTAPSTSYVTSVDGTRIAELLPNGKHTVLEGQDHGARADVVAPVVAEFFVTAWR